MYAARFVGSSAGIGVKPGLHVHGHIGAAALGFLVAPSG